MKKIILTAAFAVIGMTALTAQTFGAKAGYTNATAKVDAGEFDVSASESGFFVGLMAEFEATETIDIKPEVLYTNVSETSFLQVPVLGKFALGGGGFNIQAGPQFNFILEETGDEFNAFSLGLTGGLGYDITEKFFVEGHYALQLTDSFKGDGDVSSKTNFLNIGVGYKFN